MTSIRIFISSVQREFAQEREALRDYLRGDPLMRRFFDVFLFEDVPASDRRPDALYLDEVEQSDLYVGLFGNAVAHRDYTSNASVQVMLFTDRVEVLNPGRLPPPLTLEQLRVAHTSIPNNPLLAEPLYLAQYIERMGTGTLDMIRRCSDAGLPEPEFNDSSGFKITIWRATPPGQPESLPESLEFRVIVLLAKGPMQKSELSKSLGQKAISAQLNAVVRKLVTDQLIEYTIPDKPNS
jgi:predicted HTH transcriptional regulator